MTGVSVLDCGVRAALVAGVAAAGLQVARNLDAPEGVMTALEDGGRGDAGADTSTRDTERAGLRGKGLDIASCF